MPDAHYWRTIEEVDKALEVLAAVSYTVLVEFRETSKRAREDSVLEMVTEWGTHERRELEQAIQLTQGAVKRLRAHAIRVLVDEEGLTISHVARLMGISRQAVSALYQIVIGDVDAAGV